MGIEIAFAVLILVVMIFLATIDMAFVQLTDVNLRRLTTEAEERPKSGNALFLRKILDNRPRFRFALSAAIQTLLIIFAVLMTLIVLRFIDRAERSTLFIVSVLFSLILTTVFRQFLPRLLTFNNPEKVFLRFLPVVRPLYAVFGTIADPFARILDNREREKLEMTQVPSVSQIETNEREDDGEDLQALIEVGEAEGIIEEGEREMIETMVEFGDTTVEEIMTPRTEISALPIVSTIRQARDLMVESKHSRLPVYGENIDDVRGVLFMRDLLNVWASGNENTPIETLLRAPLFIPETKPIQQLLEQLQTAHVQMAMVVDEYGGVAGLVTVEDILEEIVGEIEDEDTRREEVIEIVESENGEYYDVLGATEIGKIEKIFDLEIEDDDFSTIAGLVTTELGYVPKIAERFTFRGLDAEILEADEKKIARLRLRRAAENSENENVDNT